MVTPTDKKERPVERLYSSDEFETVEALVNSVKGITRVGAQLYPMYEKHVENLFHGSPGPSQLELTLAQNDTRVEAVVVPQILPIIHGNFIRAYISTAQGYVKPSEDSPGPSFTIEAANPLSRGQLNRRECAFKIEVLNPESRGVLATYTFT